MFFVVRHLYNYLRPYKGQVVLLILGILIDLAFTVGLASSMEYLIDDAIGAHDRELLWMLLSGLVVAVIVAASAAVARDYLYAKLGTSVVNDLRLRLFDHLQRLSANFYAKTQVGDIVARFATDLAAVQNAVVLAIPETIIGVLGVGLSAVLLFRLEWQLALITVLALPVLTIGPRVLGVRAERASLKLREEEAAVVSVVQENIGAQPVVKAFGLEQREIASFQTRLSDVYRAGLRFNILSYLVERTPNVSFMLLHVIVLGIGVFKTFEGQLDVGELVTFNALTVTLSAYVTSLTRVSPVLLQASGGVRRIADLLEADPQVPDDATTSLPVLARDIRFRNVTFSYTGESNNLEDLSFAITAGQTVAFVGTSGSGKSTVLGLLTRFYDPDLGTIELDGRDLRQGTQASLRSQMAVVFQESFLFNTTVAENIRMGRPEASQAEIEAAAKAAEIHDLILKMPDGYDTVVGERGGRLSGGQRQRVAIARAIVRDPRILVLDEATSALDPGTEAAIGQTLKRIGKQRTVVEVTHRLSSHSDHDQIYVLDLGQMVEYGNHKQFLARRGLYQKLWIKQSGVAVSEDGNRADVTPARLKAVPILSELSTAMLEELTKLFVSERCPESRMVIRQGDAMVEKFYIIARGKVQVSKRDTPGEEERKLSVLSDGDHFGEIALIRDVPRTATIRTLTPCIFLSLRRVQFLDIIGRDPGLLEQFRAVLEARDDGNEAPTGLLARRHSRAFE